MINPNKITKPVLQPLLESLDINPEDIVQWDSFAYQLAGLISLHTGVPKVIAPLCTIRWTDKLLQKSGMLKLLKSAKEHTLMQKNICCAWLTKRAAGREYMAYLQWDSAIWMPANVKKADIGYRHPTKQRSFISAANGRELHDEATGDVIKSYVKSDRKRDGRVLRLNGSGTLATADIKEKIGIPASLIYPVSYLLLEETIKITYWEHNAMRFMHPNMEMWFWRKA